MIPSLSKVSLNKTPFIVKSSIIQKNDADFKVKAHELHNKYIKIGAEYEINISFKNRKRITDLLGDLVFLNNNQGIKMKDIYKVFEGIQQDQMVLLGYSFSRFKQQDEFDKIIEIFDH